VVDARRRLSNTAASSIRLLDGSCTSTLVRSIRSEPPISYKVLQRGLGVLHWVLDDHKSQVSLLKSG
jgi:hypothetical protein